ncbi:hypothetical protein GHT06_022731 [Daphnia sinensis]|uniref:Apple domain-containing protein n=1 Tax=Daphnia sinensis TaxID=1820382 RepID=A0AAD5KZ65_9CRUS|nr:hypothetical protein GHT06_022731 [Daphnia sinensis]
MAPKCASILLIALMMGLAIASDDQREQSISSDRQDYFYTQQGGTPLTTFKFRWYCDFPGNDLKSVTADSYFNCATFCVGNVYCNHFHFNFSNKICLLKRHETDTLSQPHRYGHCGFIPSRLKTALIEEEEKE